MANQGIDQITNVRSINLCPPPLKEAPDDESFLISSAFRGAFREVIRKRIDRFTAQAKIAIEKNDAENLFQLLFELNNLLVEKEDPILLLRKEHIISELIEFINMAQNCPSGSTYLCRLGSDESFRVLIEHSNALTRIWLSPQSSEQAKTKWRNYFE